MDNFTIVRPGHLNHHGFVFGGQMLRWVDEYAWLVAARDFAGYKLVTRAMDHVEFTTRIPCGSILRFHILPERQGTTSITYLVEVFADEPGGQEEKPVFSTRVTFVSVDDDGQKQTLPQKKILLSEQCVEPVKRRERLS
ncbi:MAG: acyl-CoA thioesterase [Spirochaetia bacterium]